MRLLAIDPGSEESAYVLYDTQENAPVEWAKGSNDEVIDLNLLDASDRMAMEMIASYGMPVGAEVFETCMWAGRFIERWEAGHFIERTEDWAPVMPVYRKDVKLHLCGSPKAKDSNIRQALIDRYGGKRKAVGLKATPGPLYGLKGDCWSALAVAITAAERT